MNIDGDGERESPDDGKGIKDGRLGENKSLFALNDLNVHAANEVEKVEVLIGLQGPSTLQVQPLPQGKVVRWERFLNVESIQVLLVENDDCTRHVVAALLRNCNYEVLMAANGLHAWKILEDLNNRIDIVLTEVVMPFLPGIPLLSKIMSHKTRKNIPVIMMSSHDSMGLVFKCLSKGAVDFLVKPIRKNELKNLWQHVWRRCHSSSGSGSESGTQTQKSVKSKGCEKSGNSGSDDGENNSSNGSDYGSGGTQSSWTKQAVEVDSSPAMSPIDQVADSTCGQGIYLNADNPGYERGHISLPKEGHELKPDNAAEVKGLGTHVPRNVEPKDKNPVETPVTVIASKLKSFSEFNCSMILNQTDMEQNYPTADCCQLSKNKGGGDETLDPSIDIIESDSTKEVANILDNNNTGPNIELSLKRLRQVEDTGRSIHDDRYVLHRSQQSAFSRYITSPNIFKAPNGVTCSSSMVDNNSAEVTKQESAHGIQAHSTDHLVYPSQNGISNILDMGSTTNKHIAHPSLMKDKSDETSTINGLHQSAFRPVKNYLRCTQIQPSSANHDESSLKKLPMDSQHCGSKNGFESMSGSNYVSNGQNVINTESDVGQDGKSGSGSGNGSGNRVDEDKVARRLAALIKFRQKKKDRCFTKKVRYINRKKLAEQRPRVRGQFVKQNGTDSSNRTSDE